MSEKTLTFNNIMPNKKIRSLKNQLTYCQKT